MTKKTFFLTTFEPLIQIAHQRASAEFDARVMDYIVPKKIFQLIEATIADELEYRMKWAEHNKYGLEVAFSEIMAGTPWHKDPTHPLRSLMEETLYAYIKRQVRSELDRIINWEDDETMDVWTVDNPRKYDIVLKNKGDYRIYVFEQFALNALHPNGFNWTYDRGIAGFRIARPWILENFPPRAPVDRNEPIRSPD